MSVIYLRLQLVFAGTSSCVQHASSQSLPSVRRFNSQNAEVNRAVFRNGGECRTLVLYGLFSHFVPLTAAVLRFVVSKFHDNLRITCLLSATQLDVFYVCPKCAFCRTARQALPMTASSPE
jgi:hypothetical protein